MMSEELNMLSGVMAFISLFPQQAYSSSNMAASKDSPSGLKEHDFIYTIYTQTYCI